MSSALDYIKGLFSTERNKRNIERMCEQTNTNYQHQHHFLSQSPWSAQDAMKVVASKCNLRLGDVSSQCLSLDESANRKAGKHSVGVSSQYNGNLGKVENSQVGVYSTLSKGNRVGIINCRLFLPDEWVNDRVRCKKAEVPDQVVAKRSKIDLALDMIREHIDDGIEFGWINADGLYGNSQHFRNSIEDLGKDFVVDIHTDQPVYLSNPTPYLPESTSTKGRKPKRLKTDIKSIEVNQYLQTLTKGDFQEVNLRKGTKGWVKGSVHIQKVWTWDGKESNAREGTLIIRKSVKKKEPVKFALSNLAVHKKTVQQFAFMQCQRFWIERAFEDGKGELGMADYQVRKYNAWYHHQVFVMMAMDYINSKKTDYQQDIPLLSVRDARLQIIAMLKNQGVQMEKEIDQMIVRHRQRTYDINRFYPENDYF